MNFLLEPLQYAFLREAIFAGAMIGIACAVLSCYLVLKGWSLMGDAVSHAVLPGIVIAYLLGLPLAIGAFVTGLLCAVATGYIKANSRVKEDTVMGVVFTGLFALGLILFAKAQSELHLDHILFGNILGIPREQIIQVSVLAVVVIGAILTLRRDLLLYCFDANHARSIGLNTTLLHYALLSLLALTIVVSLQAVGIILVIAMLITPGCVGYLLTDRFDRMLVIATISSVASSVIGVYVSYYINGSTAACIVLAQSIQFVLAMLLAPKHGLFASRIRAAFARPSGA